MLKSESTGRANICAFYLSLLCLVKDQGAHTVRSVNDFGALLSTSTNLNISYSQTIRKVYSSFRLKSYYFERSLETK